jgi:acyl carrier protein
MSHPMLSESEILERFAGIVARSLRIEPERVTSDASLGDLGAESLDLLEITMEAEDEFGILMPQKDILHMAEEVFGPGVLLADGRLTESGARLLQRRLPECADGTIAAGVAIAEIARVFQRVGTWVRVIQGLLAQRPYDCPSCGTALGSPVAGRFKCAGCGADVDLPAGDDLNRRWVEAYHRGEHELLGDGAQVA